MKTVLIIQKSLRGFFFNFGKHLKHFKFVKIYSNPPASHLSTPLNFSAEVSRVKSAGFNKYRRIIGLINLRPFFTGSGQLIFTYGCALITNKPYCICMENGLAAFNYDLVISKNPVAKILFSLAIFDPHLKQLVFLSQAAQASFFSTIKLPEFVLSAAQAKSTVCYPITGRQTNVEIKRNKTNHARFLFVGSFYMKGGLELLNAAISLNKKYVNNFSLTVVTSIRSLRPADYKLLQSTPNIAPLDSVLSPAQMDALYQNSDVFVYPTYRDSFGLVLLEAVSWGLPVICNDQFATREIVSDGITGFIYPDHPLKDYNPLDFEILGKYYDPVVFYNQLFNLQSTGQLKTVETFLYSRMELFVLNPKLLSTMQKNTSAFYRRKFHYLKSSKKIEAVFENATS